MQKNIALLRGDGIGPEIVDSAVAVLEVIAEKFGHKFHFTRYLIGGAAIDETGNPLPQETVDGCLAADSVLLGAVGGPKWDTLPANLRPEKGLLGIRAAMGLYTNLRPAKLYPALKEECPLRADIVAQGFDLMMVRELTGGISFGERGRREGAHGPEAWDTEAYSVMEVERIARAAFDAARKRRKNVISIDKANVLETSRLWRETVHRIAEEYPDVSCTSCMAALSTSMSVMVTSGYSAAMRWTVSRHRRLVSSTFALSMEMTFLRRLRAASKAARAMRSTSITLYASVS